MEHQQNSFFLSAFKPAENLTLAERAERILSQQRFIADELQRWTWFLTDKTEIDIRDDACYDLIYKQAKKGMNAKMVKITRYQPGDIPDTQSTCLFFITKKFYPEPFSVSHRLGYYGNYDKNESIGVKHFANAEHLNNQGTITGLFEAIESKYKPRELYVTTEEYFHNHSKTPNDTPRTGWITYLDNSIKLPKSKPDFCKVIQRPLGTIFQTTEGLFDDGNPKHIDNALRLEQWFVVNNVNTQSSPAKLDLRGILSKYLPGLNIL